MGYHFEIDRLVFVQERFYNVSFHKRTQNTRVRLFYMLDIHRRGVYKNHIWKFLYTRICVNEANLYSKARQGLHDCSEGHQQDNGRQAYHQGLHPSHPTGGMCGTSRKERCRKKGVKEFVVQGG